MQHPPLMHLSILAKKSCNSFLAPIECGAIRVPADRDRRRRAFLLFRYAFCCQSNHSYVGPSRFCAAVGFKVARPPLAYSPLLQAFNLPPPPADEHCFEGVSDSRHLGPGAREGGSAREKMTRVFQAGIVRCLTLSPRAERRAPIDRGERDIESEVGQPGIRRDFGTCIFTR